MKVYKVKVNGKLYEVELESVTEVKGSVSAPAAEEKAAPAPVSAGAVSIKAPIGGKVISVNVKVGDQIKKNQTVAVIEAMKLENEVPATAEGTVKEIKVQKGANVNNGDVLVILG